MQAVGVYLQELRRAQNLSQSEAADLVGVNAKTIERWEAGKHEPKITELGPYIERLQGSIEYAVNLLLGRAANSAGDMALHGTNPRLLAILADLSPGEIDLFLALAERMRRP